jgi:hypothetical protein
MRDFRDAKAMAQTLRDALAAKGVSLTHSESLELVAKTLGFHDWNVLVARIASERRSPLRDNVDNLGPRVRQEIAVDPATLDGYVGFYQLSDNAVLTITREQNQLLMQLTGQPSVPIHPESTTEFFAKVVDAQIRFISDARGQGVSLILHQHGRDISMKRVDAMTAQQIADKSAEKLKTQSANPGTEAALRRLIDGLISGTPDYDEMSAGLAEATRQQLPKLQPDLAQSGPVRSVQFLGVGNAGEDVYFVKHEHRAWHWRIALDSSGTISMAWVSPGL